ncbi:hypothetical protein B0A53_00858 [Rhodotorula sp. CCFEE 5036]|nr:hypothetical protein B0A53_00858 [Rhodotorula sp. CCFEE 5036]
MARSPKTPAPARAPTLDSFVRQPGASPSTSSKKRPAPSEAETPKKRKSLNKGKGAAQDPPTATGKATRATTSKVKADSKTTTPKKTKKKGVKKRKAFVADNRKLGTVELLDSSDESDARSRSGSQDLTVLSPPPIAGTSGVKRKAGKIILEEEDWLAEASEAKEPEAVDGNAAAAPAVDDGPEGTANLLAAEEKLRDPCEQDPRDGCTDQDDDDDDDMELVVVQEPATTDDEVIVLPSAPPPPPPQKEEGKSGTGSFLAPLSRLFTRAPPPDRASPTLSDSPDADGAPGAKKPFSVLSSLPNAFTALMAGHAETIQWKAAEKADKQRGRLPKGEERRVPFYKWIDGMEVTVDAFRYGKIDGCKAYFLSHAHSDHYQNLSSTWSGGPIYASQTTINLIKLKLGVRDEYLFPLPLDQTVKVHGIDVTLIDANHCPGSVLFLFEGPHTDPKSPYSKTPNRIFRYLHCGDFRASPAHIVHPCMSFPTPPSNKPATLQTQLRAPSMSRASSNASSSSNQGFDPVAGGFVDPLPGRTQKKLDAIYLDTTYLGPSYCFPAQELVISACAELVKERVIGGDESALWRADGRDGERKGLKGWLARTGDVKDEVKADEDETSAMMELEALPEDYDEDNLATTMREETPLHGLHPGPSGSTPIANAGDGEDEPDEEAWLAAHEGPAERRQEELSEGIKSRPCSDEAPSTDDNAAALIKAEGDVNTRGSTRQAWEGEDRNPSVKSETELVREVLGNAAAAQLSSHAQQDLEPEAVKAEDEKPDLKPKKERLLVLVGTYSIGKERIVKAIAHALSTKVYCDGYKRSLCLAQDDPDLHALLTENPLEAQVHIGGLRDITREVMQDYLGKYKAPRIENGFTKMIGLRPTGWTYRSESKDKLPSIAKILQIEQQRKFSPAGLYPQRDSTPLTMAFGVPYSEHSSFFELTCFCLSLDYTRVIPTVNVHTANSRNKMKAWIDRWAAEKKRRKDAKLPRIVPFRNINYW